MITIYEVPITDYINGIDPNTDNMNDYRVLVQEDEWERATRMLVTMVNDDSVDEVNNYLMIKVE